MSCRLAVVVLAVAVLVASAPAFGYVYVAGVVGGQAVGLRFDAGGSFIDSGPIGWTTIAAGADNYLYTAGGLTIVKRSPDLASSSVFAVANQLQLGPNATHINRVYVDQAGNLYAVPFGNGTDLRMVAKYDSAGNYIGSFSAPGLTRPVGAAVDAAGNLYVGKLDYTNGHSILVFDSSGILQGSIKTAGLRPNDLAVDWLTNTLYIGEDYGTAIRTYNIGTGTWGSIPVPGLAYGAGIDFSWRTGLLYVADYNSNTAYAINARGGGEVVATFTYGPAYQLRDVTALPEPGSLVVLGTALAASAGLALRKRRS